jgi:hypothetical protein
VSACPIGVRGRSASWDTAIASAGRVSDARRVLDELLELRAERYVSGYDIALIYTGLRDADAALTWLEQAERDRAHQMAFLKVESRLDSLRSLPRFSRLLDRMNLGTAAVKPAAAGARLL